MKRRGFSLAEAMVVCAVLGVVFTGAFLLFTMGYRAFYRAELRSGIQGDARRVKAVLERDVRLTHFASIGVVERNVTTSDGIQVRRDGVAMVALSDWNNSSNFSAGVSPLWDRYSIFYATSGDLGKLIHQEIEPGGVLAALVPYPVLGSNLNEDPDANADVYSSGVLCENVLEFKLERDEARQLLNVNLRLRGRQGSTMLSGQTVDESHEVVLSLRAWNTFPEL